MSRPIAAEQAALIAAAAITDIVRTVDAEQWRQRAKILEACRPRRGDYFGAATREQLVEQDRRLAEAAQACRSRAALIEPGEDT